MNVNNYILTIVSFAFSSLFTFVSYFITIIIAIIIIISFFTLDFSGTHVFTVALCNNRRTL